MNHRSRPPAIDLEVERLVLHDLGISPARAEHVRELVEAELGRLLAHAPLDSSSAAIPVRVVDAPGLGAGSSDHDLAASLARAIARAVDEA